MIHCSEIKAFTGECKRLTRKYRSLEKDIERFKKVLQVKATEKTMLVPAKHWAILTSAPTVGVVKTRLACEYLRGEFMRIVFAWHPAGNRIVFLELYYKGDKEAEDQQRYQAYLNACQ